MEFHALLDVDTNTLKSIRHPEGLQTFVMPAKYGELKRNFIPVKGKVIDGVYEIENREELLKNALMKNLKEDRDNALQSLVSTQGKYIYDCRPQDFLNLVTGIELGQTEWLDANNEVIPTDVETLQAVLSEGKQKAKDIWKGFIESVKAL